jgi:hypothetical protein
MALTACGGRKPAEAEQHQLYRTIQEGEAAQDRAASGASGSPYVNPLEVADAICESSRSICKAAKRSRERDAKERCQRARERCDAAMGAATGR